eukprot:3728735-Prymnesium_polylepis.1
MAAGLRTQVAPPPPSPSLHTTRTHTNSGPPVDPEVAVPPPHVCISPSPVSYTHLRAHETLMNL